MPWHDLPLPPALARLIELLLAAVGRGVRMAGRLLAEGHVIRTRMIVRRVSTILRHVILLLAVRLELAPRHGAAATAPPIPQKSAHGGGGGAAFSLWSSIPASRHPKPAQPDLGSMGSRDWIPNPAAPVWDDDRDGVGGWTEQTIAKKLRALCVALANPLRYARRLARKLRGGDIFIAPKVPTTIPKTSARDFWEERLIAVDEARFALSEFWRARRDTS